MKEDEFTIKLLETLKGQFDDKSIYPGKTVRTLIDGMIERLRRNV